MIKIKSFVFSPFSENTYIVWDEESRETAIIDPGTLENYEVEELTNFVRHNNLQVKYLINTHCHLDHIFGNNKIKQIFNPKFYAPELDIPLLQNATKQGSQFGIKFDDSPLPDEYISEELNLSLGIGGFTFLFTPGHTPGEYCIYFKEEKFCITGDVLFLESIGRTDLWGGDYERLIESIKTKLFTLPDETIIYPGHGETSTIGYEKKFNPFLK
ncbi:MAG: MBL fold metallo-hydrolase [Ignavibacteriaceae bacterium]|nr:MBL fold metallo-hydrolase [Ignavibacteriaceae bacterium]